MINDIIMIYENDKINKLKCEKFFNEKELNYYIMINEFYSMCDKKLIEIIIDIIEGKSKISLRILDWFISRFSKTVILFNSSNENNCDIHISYKAQLKTYKKKYFDPFRRHNKFFYFYDKNKYVLTTLGQLNFFKWMICKNILSYVIDNINNIINNMTLSNKKYKIVKNKKNNNIQINNNEEYVNQLFLHSTIYF